MKKPLQLAILLLIHNSPSGMARLLNVIYHPNVIVFIHVDAKVPLQPFLDIFTKNKNLVFLTEGDRCVVNWGGRSQVTAMMNLMRVASTHSVSFDRFLTLTGSDYPIRSMPNLLTYLEDVTSEIIRVDRIVDTLNDNKIRPLSLHDVSFLNPRNYRGVLGKVLKNTLWAVRKIKFGGAPTNLTIVHGSSSFCLTRKAVIYILYFHDQLPSFYRSLRFSFSSDELYFHSILFNKGFDILHNYVARVPARKKNIHGLHYIDWGSSSNSGPKMLNSRDISSFSCVDGAFFVRKVDPMDVDFLGILDKISNSIG